MPNEQQLHDTIQRCRSDLNQIAGLVRQLERAEQQNTTGASTSRFTNEQFGRGRFGGRERHSAGELQRIEQLVNRCEGDLSRLQSQAGQFGAQGRAGFRQQPSFGAYGSSYNTPDFGPSGSYGRHSRHPVGRY